MARVGRWIWVTLALLLFATAAGAALPHFAFELQAPHAAHRSTAVLDEGLRQALDAGIAKSEPDTVEKAVDFSLAVTDKILHFGLSHPTSKTFTITPREANCIEYAELFARVFDKAAAEKHLPARAFVVHSDKARFFGQKVPMKGWGDHDWVLIEDKSGDDKAPPRRWYVDPTLHDAGLGWDISSNVKGEIKLPR
ncbi:MAG: hypothetical protein ABI193_18170 [Minicystis sp.]